jgi:hypothetical protein
MFVLEVVRMLGNGTTYSKQKADGGLHYHIRWSSSALDWDFTLSGRPKTQRINLSDREKPTSSSNLTAIAQNVPKSKFPWPIQSYQRDGRAVDPELLLPEMAHLSPFRLSHSHF